MKLKLLVAATALSAVAGSAFAATGAYVGVGVSQGFASVSDMSHAPGPAVQITWGQDKTNATGGQLRAGYDFTDNWGIEGGHNALGRYSLKNQMSVSSGNQSASAQLGKSNYSLSNWYLAGTGSLPLNEDFTLIGKLGVAWNHVSGDQTVALSYHGPTGEDTFGVDTLNYKSKISPMIGVGASYAFNKQISAQLEYDYFGKVATVESKGLKKTSDITASALTLSAAYHF